MKPTHLLAIAALSITAATAAPSVAVAQSYSAPQTARFQSNDAGREGRFYLGSAAGVLPGDVAEALDDDDNAIPGLTFRIYKVRAGESYGKLEGALTKDRIEAVKKAGSSMGKGRFSHQPANRTKCQTTVPRPIKASDKAEILAGRPVPGYVIVPIDLTTPISNGDSYATAQGGSKQLVLPAAKAYIVTYSAIYEGEVTTVRDVDATINIAKVDIKAGTMGVAMAKVARVAIPVGACN